MRSIHRKLLVLAISLTHLGVSAQECASGLGSRKGHVAKPSIVNSYPGGRWSATRPRYQGRVAFGPKVRAKNVRQLDMPLERCAILAMTGVGIGYLGERDQQWVGVPAVAISVALPFPGQPRGNQFSGGRWKQKLLGLFGMTVSYGVGLGVGANMKHEPNK